MISTRLTLAAVVSLFGMTLARADTPTTAPADNNAAALAPGAGTIPAYTAPSDSRKLDFGSSGLIMSVPVKEGDAIKKGQVLIELDDVIQSLEAKKAKVDADSTARIEAAKADLDEKKVVLKRKQDVNNQGGYNQSEIEEAQLDVTLREKQLQVSKEDQADAKAKAEQEQRRLEQMRIVAPFDGSVLKIVAHEGESFDPQRPDGAIQVVKNDPLFIEIGELSTRQAGLLKLGQTLRVRYPDDPTWHDASVIFRSPEADARSDTQGIRLSMPNPENRDSGLHVIVELPSDVAAAANNPQGIAGSAGSPLGQ